MWETLKTNHVGIKHKSQENEQKSRRVYTVGAKFFSPKSWVLLRHTTFSPYFKGIKFISTWSGGPGSPRCTMMVHRCVLLLSTFTLNPVNRKTWSWPGNRFGQAACHIKMQEKTLLGVSQQLLQDLTQLPAKAMSKERDVHPLKYPV